MNWFRSLSLTTTYLFQWQKTLLVDAFQTFSDVVIRGDSPLSTPAKHAFENNLFVSHFNAFYFTSVFFPPILGFNFLLKTNALQNMTSTWGGIE